MLKAVFMSQGYNKELIDRVYSEETKQKIQKHAQIYPYLIDKENLQEHKEYLQNADVIFCSWGMPVLTKEDIKTYLPNLKAIFYGAGTVQYFARPFLESEVRIVSAWAANAVPVAEYTLSQILLANKGFFQNCIMSRKDYYAAMSFSSSFPGNFCVKAGILGAGMVGTKVIELLKQFNIEILVYDPFLSDSRAKEMGVRKCTLHEIFSQCQTISNHIANLPATVGMLNKECFDLMLPNATFINTGRGAQVVEKDLIKALKDVPTRTAVLDVTEPEPLPADSELLKMDNVIITSHIAGSMGNEVARMGEYMAEEFERYIQGKQLRYEVTLKMLETMA